MNNIGSNVVNSDVLWTYTHGHTSTGHPVKTYFEQTLIAAKKFSEELWVIVGVVRETGICGISYRIKKIIALFFFFFLQ